MTQHRSFGQLAVEGMVEAKLVGRQLGRQQAGELV